MKLRFVIFWLFLSTIIVNAQINRSSHDPTSSYQAVQNDTTKLKRSNEPKSENDTIKQTFNPTIKDYLYWTEKTEKSIFDTVLSIESYYKQNYLQKDLFGYMPFPNSGQTVNPLIPIQKSSRIQLIPTGKSFQYIAPEDVRYFDVKTPTTEFVYENGVKQGNSLSTLFTHNLSKNVNYSIQYRGLRSQGGYTRELSSNNSFIAGVNYHNDSKRFNLWTHYAAQNVDNQENGGIEDLADLDDDNLTNPQNLSVNLQSAQTKFDSRRIHIGATYGLFGKALNAKDSTATTQMFVLKNIFTYEKQKFEYKESSTESFFSSSVFDNLNRKNLKSFEVIRNQSTVGFNWSDKLHLEGGLKYENLKLYGDQTLSQGLVFVPIKADDNMIGFIGNLSFDWNDKLKVLADASFSSGNIFKNVYEVNGKLYFEPLNNYALEVGANVQSTPASLNLLYNQSFYKNFNYYNLGFDNVNTQNLYGKLIFKKFKTDVEASVMRTENLVYLDGDFKVRQLDGEVSYFSVKLNNLLTYHHFHLRTTAQYQNVTQNETYMPLPDLILRGSLYWQDFMFKKAAEVQAGINVYCFSEYNSSVYFPVLNEFALPYGNAQEQKIGGSPLLDLFINLKVDRMRFYIRGEHINDLFQNKTDFSAPYIPFRGFKFQIGIKWILFT